MGISARGGAVSENDDQTAGGMSSERQEFEDATDVSIETVRITCPTSGGSYELKPLRYSAHCCGGAHMSIFVRCEGCGKIHAARPDGVEAIFE